MGIWELHAIDICGLVAPLRHKDCRMRGIVAYPWQAHPKHTCIA